MLCVQKKAKSWSAPERVAVEETRVKRRKGGSVKEPQSKGQGCREGQKLKKKKKEFWRQGELGQVLQNEEVDCGGEHSRKINSTCKVSVDGATRSS